MADLLLRRQRRRSSCWRRNMAATAARRSVICDKFEPPVAAFPAHWAPNDLKIYKGSQFPEGLPRRRLHRLPRLVEPRAGPQGGYNVVFQPLSDGKTSGDYIVFADGFAGKYKEPGRAAHRPSGLAVGPDGALYISDDKAGRIWRVTYVGDPEREGIRGRARLRRRSQSSRLTPCRPRAFIPMPAPRACRCRPEPRATRSRSARRSSMARWPGRPVPDVMAPTASAPRLAPI